MDLLCALEHWTTCWRGRWASGVIYIILGLVLKKLLIFGGAKKVGRLVDNELITKAECHLALPERSASRLDFSLQGESLPQVRLLSWALTEEQDLEWQE